MAIKLDLNNDENTEKILLDEKNKDFSTIKRPVMKQTHKLKHNIRSEIQTLRAIAIFSVLLFHLWEEKFYFGFLGVDIFFVISGYLMCSILSKKQSLNFRDILTFYERRFKRIVPLYLFTTSVVLFSLFYVVSEIQFHQIFKEAIKAITFTSNIPSTEQKGYFDNESRFYFFLHTWSLSVEIQFYLIVPIIFLVFDLTNKYNCFNKYNCLKNYADFINTSLIIVTILLSFTHQVFTENPNSKYMSLSGRIWQFFFGFMAYKIRQHYINEKNRSNARRKALYFSVLSLLLFTLLCNFRIDFLITRQVNRFIAIFLATYIVAESNQLPKLMENKAFVVLGDVSYSVYLIHWPLITWYRYVNIGQDESEEISVEIGLIIIAVSILLGYVVEKVFKFVLKHINSWTILILAISIGYTVNGLLLYRIEHNAVNLNENLDEIANTTKPDNLDILHLPMHLKFNETLKPTGNETREEMLRNYNTALFNVQYSFDYCPDKFTLMPTNFTIDYTYYTALRHCYEAGNGTKNIVLIGNSHADFNYVGIADVFRPVYKNLYTYVKHSCMPTFSDKFQGVRNEKLGECVRYIKEYLPVLQQWKEPIDILIVMFGLIGVPELTINGPIENDPFLQEMQTFYQNIEKIPKEAMIIQGASLFFKEHSYYTFMSKIKSRKDYLKIGQSRKSVVNKAPNLYKRVNGIDCGKNCLKMNWIDFWCGKNKDGFCKVIDPISGLLYFTDENHISPYGSVLQAKYMFEQYEFFVKNETVIG